MKTMTYVLPEWVVPVLENGDNSHTIECEDNLLNNFIEVESKGGLFQAINFEPIGFQTYNDLTAYAEECYEVTFQTS